MGMSENNLSSSTTTATTTATSSVFSEKIVDALVAILQSANSPEMLQAQQMLIRRMVLSGDVVPSRIPPPLNITEIGGYLNLLEVLEQPELRAQALASIFGVAGPNPPLGWFPGGPVLFYAMRQNDRPAGPMQAAIPTHYLIRSDFAIALDGAVSKIHSAGCQLPIMSRNRYLPPATPHAVDQQQLPLQVDMLGYIGRVLTFVPSAALVDPDTDPLALARIESSSDLQVVARQLDASASEAGTVSPANWVAWKCNSLSCQETPATSRPYLPLGSIMNAAGWYQQQTLSAPESLAKPGNWSTWTNITGLVTGVTRYGDELSLLYTPQEIATSSLRERLNWVWSGTEFAPAP